MLKDIEPAAVRRGKGGNQVDAADAAAPAPGAIVVLVVAVVNGATRGRRGDDVVVVVTPVCGVDCLGWRRENLVVVAG